MRTLIGKLVQGTHFEQQDVAGQCRNVDDQEEHDVQVATEEDQHGNDKMEPGDSF